MFLCVLSLFCPGVFFWLVLVRRVFWGFGLECQELEPPRLTIVLQDCQRCNPKPAIRLTPVPTNCQQSPGDPSEGIAWPWEGQQKMHSTERTHLVCPGRCIPKDKTLKKPSGPQNKSKNPSGFFKGFSGGFV